MKLWHALVVSMILLCGMPVFSQSQSAFIGKWELDTNQSELSANSSSIKSLTLEISKDSQKMLTWHGHGMDKDGKSFDIAWSGPEDGSKHPTMFNGNATLNQYAKKVNEAILRHGEDDNGYFDSRMTISQDGKTLTDEIVDKSKDGKETREKEVFHRVSAHP